MSHAWPGGGVLIAPAPLVAGHGQQFMAADTIDIRRGPTLLRSSRGQGIRTGDPALQERASRMFPAVS